MIIARGNAKIICTIISLLVVLIIDFTDIGDLYPSIDLVHYESVVGDSDLLCKDIASIQSQKTADRILILDQDGYSEDINSYSCNTTAEIVCLESISNKYNLILFNKHLHLKNCVLLI